MRYEYVTRNRPKVVFIVTAITVTETDRSYVYDDQIRQRACMRNLTNTDMLSGSNS